MSNTAKITKANLTLFSVRIVRKSSTNEYVVRFKGDKTDDRAYYTDDVDDAISTARHLDKASMPKRTPTRKPARRKAKSIPVGRQSASIQNHGSKTGSGPDHYTVTLRRGGKPVMRIQAVGVDQYRRALAAADLWSRGATVASIEKVVGKHVNS